MVVAGEGLPFDQMDEGESSEEEGLDLEAGEHFDLAAAAGGAQAAAGAAAAGPPAGDGAAPLVVQASPAETLLRALSRQNTRARNRLRCPLSRPVGANIVLVKLINQVRRRLLREAARRWCRCCGRWAGTPPVELPWSLPMARHTKPIRHHFAGEPDGALRRPAQLAKHRHDVCGPGWQAGLASRGRRHLSPGWASASFGAPVASHAHMHAQTVDLV